MAIKLRVGSFVLVGEHRLVCQVHALDHETFTVLSANGPMDFPIDTPLEPVASRKTALALLERLTIPPDTNVLPPQLEGSNFKEREAFFSAASLAVQVALLNSYLYLPGWYDRPSGEVFRRGADTVWNHLAASLEATPRDVRRAVFRRDPAELLRRGPVRVKDHEYVGEFSLGATAVVADRCHTLETGRNLARRLRAEPGTWHAWIRPDLTLPGRNLALLAIHEDHLASRTLDEQRLGAVGVDAGCVAILDAHRLASDAFFASRVRHAGFHWEDELVEGSGCYAMTHMGDGVYDVFAHRVRGRAVLLRVDLDGSAEDDDTA